MTQAPLSLWRASTARCVALLAGDAMRMECLRAVAALALPQGVICAGFIRNAVWDATHGLRTPLADIDVVYFDRDNRSRDIEAQYEAWLRAWIDVPWQVRNQARMHLARGIAPYRSCRDAVRRFPETATCLAVELSPAGVPRMSVNLGVVDAWSGVLRPNDRCIDAWPLLLRRADEKGWLQRWPNLRMVDSAALL